MRTYFKNKASLTNYWRQLRVVEDAERQRFQVGSFLPADHPAGIMEVVNNAHYVDRARAEAYYAPRDPNFIGFEREETVIANAPLSMTALAKLGLAAGIVPSSEIIFPGCGGSPRPAESFLNSLFQLDPRFHKEASIVLADYMPFPLENLAAKFPALGALNSDGRFSTRFTDLRSPRKINVPFWQVAIYLFDSFPAKLIHKKGGEYYEVLFKMIFPYDLPDAGGDCYDSGQQKEGILRALEIAKSTGQPPINIPDQLGYETKLRRIGNLNQYQFGSEIEAITRGLDTATFFVNNQALTTIIKLAQAAGDLPWLLQILDMGRLQLKTQDPYGFNILTGDPVNFCWVDLTIPLWQEVLERRGLRCQAMHYQNFLETGLGHKVCLLESLLRKETRFDYSFNRSLLPPELDYYLMDKSSYRQPGFDKYLLSRLGAIVARAIREDHKLFLTPQGDDDLGMAFEADLDRENIIKGPWFKPLIDSEQPNPRQFRLIDYLTAHIDLVWGKDAFHERRGNESGVDLNYIEISNHLSPSA